MTNFTIEILVEELSMKCFLEGILPRIANQNVALNENCFIRKHEGKQDLQKQLPGKIRAFSRFSTSIKVIVIQDQDTSDCFNLKSHLSELILNNGNIPHLIRIACRELEAWYLGDMNSLEKVYPNFKAKKYIKKSKFRNPDNCNAFDEIRKIIPEFQKVKAAEEISSIINIETNNSPSFQNFITGFKRLADV